MTGRLGERISAPGGGGGGGTTEHADLTDTDTEGHPIAAIDGLVAALAEKLTEAEADALYEALGHAHSGTYVAGGNDVVVADGGTGASTAAGAQTNLGVAGNRVDSPPSAPNAADYEFEATATSLPSGWSWVNQGAASYDESLGAGVITTVADNLSAAPAWRGIARNLPAGSTWTIKTKMTLTAMQGTVGTFAGLGLRESGTGELSIIYLRAQPSHYGVSRYSSPSAFSADVAAQAGRVTSPASMYFAIRKNSATSFDWMVSHDGIGWLTLAAANDSSAFFTPDQLVLISESDVVGKVSYHWLRCT